MNELATIPPELAAEIPALEAQRGRENLPTWFLGQQAMLDALAERVKEQSAVMLRQIETRRRALNWKWGLEFSRQVADDLAAEKGKRKSVDYATGRAGFRATPGKLTIVDAEQLRAWCEAHYMDGLKLEISKSAIDRYFKDTGEVPPGCHYSPPGDRFYPSVEVPVLAREEAHGDERSGGEGSGGRLEAGPSETDGGAGLD